MNTEILIKYKEKLVEAMKNFDQFCTQHNLNYFACSGTAIGAIRHKGFIPWDDDIDVLMLREDYQKLIANRGELEGSGYSIKTLGDEEYIYSYAKFIDDSTTLIEMESYPNCVIGVFIDIFPLDEVSGDIREIALKKQNYNIAYRYFQDTYQTLSFRSILSSLYRMNFTRLKNLFLMRLPKIGDEIKNELRTAFIEYDKEWCKDKGEFIMSHACVYKVEKEMFKKEWFHKYIYMEFENIKVRIPYMYDEYLTQLFGDYMTPPPEDKRISTHCHYYLNLRERLTIEEVQDRIKRGEVESY